MKPVYFLLVLLVPTFALYPEPEASVGESSVPESAVSANSNDLVPVPASSASTAQVNTKSSKATASKGKENAAKPSVQFETNSVSQAAKKFGVLLINTTNPFVFNPATAALSFNVSKGRDGSILKVSGQQVCEKMCDVSGKAGGELTGDDGDECQCSCPYYDCVVGDPDSDGNPDPLEPPKCCINNDCSADCVGAGYENGGTCSDDGDCICNCGVCDDYDSPPGAGTCVQPPPPKNTQSQGNRRPRPPSPSRSRPAKH